MTAPTMSARRPAVGTTATLRRIGHRGRSEMTLFWRNRTAVFTALVLPVATMAVFAGMAVDEEVSLPANGFMLSATLGFVLLYVVYYNLVTAYVARREELVLKRLRTGEAGDFAILAGTAVPAVAIALMQTVLTVAAGAVWLGLPLPVNLPVLLVGLVAGIVVCVLLAAASSVFTRNVEMAQVSTLPVLVACMVGSGLMVPLTELPGPVESVLRLLPLSPVVELIRLGWMGTTGVDAPVGFTAVFGEAIGPVVTLAAWLVLLAVVVRRRFRWEPRR